MTAIEHSVTHSQKKKTIRASTNSETGNAKSENILK